MNARETYNAWERETRDAAYGSVGYRANAALLSGQANAQDAIGWNVYPTEGQARLALDSIAFTSAFTEDAAVREWFASRGYRW